MLRNPLKNAYLEQGSNSFRTASLVLGGGSGGGSGMTAVSAETGQPSPDSDAPSALYGGG